MGKQKIVPPMRFEPSDFSTDKYRCVNVINLKDRCPVIIMASESCDPPYYRVMDGALEMFYLSLFRSGGLLQTKRLYDTKIRNSGGLLWLIVQLIITIFGTK